MQKSSKSAVGRLAMNTRGNVAVLFGLALLPIALGIGVAIDYGRALIVRERMASAADAAALAIGSWTGLTEAELKLKAQQYFDANYPATTLGSVGALNVTFVGNDIHVDVSGEVPTTFMRLANVSAVDVGSSAVITVRQRNIEVALVLDTTGSMRSGSKMTSMKTAATSMVTTLFGDKAASEDVKISVVPFSGAVNIGTDKLDSGWLDKATYPNTSDIAKEDHEFSSGQSVLTLFNDLNNTSWGGCVRERGGAYELTDDTPSSTSSKFALYFAPDEPDDDHDNGNNYTNDYISDGNCGTRDESKRKPNKCQRYTGKYNNAQPSRGGPNYNCPVNPITALTNVKATINTAIDALSPKGNTVIPAGLLWGWRVLSPSEPFTEGAAYDSEKWIKAIVLLTDGENYVHQGGNGHNESNYNAFGFAKKGHLGSKSGSEAHAQLNAKTVAVCSAIKVQGIRVYTIGFQVYDSTTINMLKSCATEPAMAYLSPTSTALTSIFDSIAQGLSDLRIAQ